MVERQTESAGVKIQFSVFSFQFSVFSFQKLAISPIPIRDSGDSLQIQEGLKTATGQTRRSLHPGNAGQRIGTQGRQVAGTQGKQNANSFLSFALHCVSAAWRPCVFYPCSFHATLWSAQVRCDDCGKADLPNHRPKHRIEPTVPFPKSVFRL